MHARVAALAVPMLLMTVLSGCAEEGGKEEALQELVNEAQKLEVQATSTTGVIRGIVVDDAVRPIEGAAVTLLQPAMNTTSNEAGAFAFEGLPAGTYFFQVVRRGYTEVQASADVVAGVANPDAVRVQLVAIDLPTPAVETYSFRMHLSGSAWVQGPEPVGGTGVTCCFVEQLGPERSWFFNIEFGGSNGTSHVQFLTSWEAQSPAAEQALVGASLLDEDDDEFSSNGTTGPSPQVLDFTSADIEDNTAFGITGSIYAAPSSGAPVGLSFEQDYNLFAVVFLNFEPPTGYRFDRDGPPVVPPA